MSAMSRAISRIARSPLAVSRDCASASVRRTLTPALSQGERGFSLIEVLLAIFILGVGVISIAALFPAGIAQQRRSNDEMMGPIVAEAALEVIRRKVRPDDFGTLEEFAPALPDSLAYLSPTIPGDWPWLRPGIYLEDDPGTTTIDERGMLDVFSRGSTRISGIFSSSIVEPAAGLQRATEYPEGFPAPPPDTRLVGIPYNGLRYDFDDLAGSPTPLPEPGFFITQQERYYPLATQLVPAGQRPPQPQYVWDCMFRRFQGKVQVAIFVYRMSSPGGSSAGPYVVPMSAQAPFGVASAVIPPLPISLDLIADPGTGASPPPYCIGGPWDNYGLTIAAVSGQPTREDDRFVLGTEGGTELNPQDPRHAWQVAGQWLLDQNNVIHRVASVERDGLAAAVRVELAQPAPAFIPLNGAFIKDLFFYDPAPPSGLLGVENIVTKIWYIPTYLAPPSSATTFQGTDFILTPVYLTVREL